MKLKKFFAGVLAAAMMLTVGATAAFATEPIGVPAGEGDKSYNRAKMFTVDDPNLELTKELHVASGTAPDTMKFDFTVKSGAATVATPSVTFNKADNADGAAFTADNTYSRKVTINLNEILGDNKTQVGTYNYTITENDTTIPGITKDNKTVKMTVTVVNKESNNLSESTGYGYIVALRNNEDSQKSDGKFTNTYNAYDLMVKKVVKGNFADLKDEFTFVITLYKANGMDNNYANAIVTSTNNVSAWTWTADGKAQKEVTLKHNQTATISNLPVGVTYTVTEKGADAEGWIYTTVGQIKDKAAIIAGENKVEITNTHEGTPDMGVILDNAPYIALLAIVAIGGVALMLNKRRRDEE